MTLRNEYALIIFKLYWRSEWSERDWT